MLNVFSGCTGLSSITIGSVVQTIYSYAFANCTELTDVYCYAVNVPKTNGDVFWGSLTQYATLHVPEESLETYKNRNPWNKFGTIVGLSGLKCATPTISYGGKKLMFVCDTEDVEFVTEIKVADNGKFFDDRITLTLPTKSACMPRRLATRTLTWQRPRWYGVAPPSPRPRLPQPLK